MRGSSCAGLWPRACPDEQRLARGCSRLWAAGRDSWGTLGSGKLEIPFGGEAVTAASLVLLVFLSKAANLTAVIDEKEQTLQEKTEVILQKEQEIFQLKKGEESAPVEPSDLLPTRYPCPEAAQSHRADGCPPVPGLGHDSALSQMHQLQSELESLQSLRAEESEAAARDDVLRLPSPEQGLTLSVPEPHVSAHWSGGPGVARQDARLTAAVGLGEAVGRRWWAYRMTQLVLSSSGILGRSLPCAPASSL